MDYYSAIEKEEGVSCALTWKLSTMYTILGEQNQIEKYAY